MAMTDEEIIHNLCMTYRHDYDLRKEPGEPSWTAGMTEADAKMLYKVMEQLYNSCLKPLIEERNGKREPSKRRTFRHRD
jgi:hypothetical protein